MMLGEQNQLITEETIIGLLLRKPHLALHHELNPIWFVHHAATIKAMLTLISGGIAIDVVALSKELQSRDALANLSEIQRHNTAAPDNFKHYLNSLKSIHKAKCADSALLQASKSLHNGKELDVVLSGLMQDIVQLSSSDQKRNSYNLNEALGLYFDHLEKVIETKDNGGMGLKTGIHFVDKVLGGMHPGDLIVVGARPGVGKTAFGLTALMNIAKSGKRVGFVSTEMSVNQVMLRITSMESGIDGNLLRDGDLAESDWPILTTVTNKIAKLDFKICDRPLMTASDVLLQCKAWALDGGLDFVVVDYLTRIKPDKPSGNRTIDVGEIATSMKNIARQLEIPVMVLAQLNRNVDNRADDEPRMSDLRDSGVIEQEADQILMLYRNQSPDGNDLAKILIEKNRHGEIADVNCQYLAPIMKWTSRQAA